MQFTSPTNRQPTTCLKRPPHDQENRGPNNNANNVDQQKKKRVRFSENNQIHDVPMDESSKNARISKDYIIRQVIDQFCFYNIIPATEQQELKLIGTTKTSVILRDESLSILFHYKSKYPHVARQYKKLINWQTRGA